MKHTNLNQKFREIKSLGDPHNGNKCVTLVEGKPGDFFIKKPRSLNWEYQILDKNSPFRNALRNIKGNNFDAYLGHVHYHLDTQNKPYLADYIVLDNSSELKSDLFIENIGRLFTFCTVLGLIDLHKSNCIRMAEHIQLVDIECLFFSAESPADTLLVNNRKTLLVNSVLSEIISPNFNDSIDTKFTILINGLWSEFHFFLANYSQIYDCLSSLQNISVDIPIRVLLRDTKEYQSQVYSQALIEEEKVQITRGDIPYFFGYIGSSSIYYLSSENQLIQVPQKSLDFIEQKIKRSFLNVESLMDRTRLLRIFKQSVMIVASRFYPQLKSYIFENHEYKLKFDNGVCIFESQLFNCQANVAGRS